MCVKPQTAAEAATFKSIEELTARLTAGETTSHVYLDRGRAYKQVAYLAEAIDDLTLALESAPPLTAEEQANAYNLRGMAHRRLAHYPAGIADTSRAVVLRPDHAPYWADRGWANTCGGLPEQGLADFAHCLELNPFFLAYIYRGLTHFVMGNYQASLADFDRVIELYPQQIAFNSYLNRAILRLMLHGDTQGAEADLDIAVQRNPDAIKPGPRPFVYRGLTRALEGRIPEALADLEAGAHLGDDLAIPLARGYIHHRQGNPEAMSREVKSFMRSSEEQGMTVEHSLQIAASFMANPVAALPSLLPLVA